MRFPGEQEDLDRVLALGAKWGYGNLISELVREWDRVGKEMWGMDKTGQRWIAAWGEILAAPAEEDDGE